MNKLSATDVQKSVGNRQPLCHLIGPIDGLVDGFISQL